METKTTLETTLQSTVIGRKFDTDKPRWSLLPWAEVKEIVQVLTYGSHKYEDYNWIHVTPFRTRYFDAMIRHVTAWQAGEKIDESGFSHLAHAGCCLLFLMWGDNNSSDVDKES